jgi:transketolase
MGGSADLGPSNKSIIKGEEYYSSKSRTGRNFHFGIREHAMGAIVNGINAHGGMLGYSATFFSFSDYMKNAMRMSALMNLNSTYILTHDSIGVGEDGPTHQPIEQLIGLRSIPNMKVFRPCDSRETIAGWKTALWEKGPTSLVLSRQNLPLIEGTCDLATKGGYILKDCEGTPDVVLLASGSEVSTLAGAAELLRAEGVKIRLVSVPSEGLFRDQSREYQLSILPEGIRRYGLTSGLPCTLAALVGENGMIQGLDHFGYSAPAGVLDEKFGYTPAQVYENVKKFLK